MFFSNVLWSKRNLIQNLCLNSMMLGVIPLKLLIFVFSWSEKLATPVAQRLDRVLRHTNSARKVILYLLFASVKLSIMFFGLFSV
jgi:hypothetical protein